MKRKFENGEISNYRSGKQCRERWNNRLERHINKDDWSLEEEKTLFTKNKLFGNKWSEISKYLNRRTDNAIKNHYYSSLRKKIRRLTKEILKSKRKYSHYSIDIKLLNPNAVYKKIKRKGIRYLELNDETLLDLIFGKANDTENKKNEGFNKKRSIFFVTYRLQ